MPRDGTHDFVLKEEELPLHEIFVNQLAGKIALMLEKIRHRVRQTDIFLLVFLLTFTIDMVVMKPLALGLAFVFIGRELRLTDIKASPLFYLLMPLLGMVNFFFFNSDFSIPHWLSFGIGCAYWFMCLLAFLVLKHRVHTQKPERVRNALTSFFWINFTVSLFELIRVMALAGNINPYGMLHVDFGNSTGDYIQGVFMAPCYINTFVNCAFAFYFIAGNRYVLSFLAVLIACLTTSNFASIMLVVLLLAALFVFRQRKQLFTLLAQLTFVAIFYLFVSTNNLNYIMGTLGGKPDSVEMVALRKMQGEMNLRLQSALTVFDGRELQSNYGKGISFELTYNYLTSSPQRLLTGAGIGEFSSQLAVRTSDITGRKKSRLFRMLPQYISDDFYQNHYQVFSVIYDLPEEYHSIRHLPNSFINQIFGEYGVLGFLSFLVFYIWYFLRKARSLRYSIFVGILMVWFLLFDYMFEYLSLIVFFELFFLVDLKQGSGTNEPIDAA